MANFITTKLSGYGLRAILDHHQKYLGEDVIAGMTGAVAGAPQAMGFAIIAGVSPIYGLYTAFVATIIGSLFSGSTLMTIAPTNAVALVVGTSLMRFDAATQIERLFILTLLVGIFQLLFGILRLGKLTQFVSHAVMTGFVTGAGLLIINGQLRHITGYRLETDGVLPRFWEWLTRLPESNPETVIIGLMTIGIILALRNTYLKNAGILIALIITAVIIYAAGWQHVATVRSVSAIPSGFPSPVIPDWRYIPELLNPALALAILALVQSAALVQSIPEPNEGNVNRDFIGQGIANIVSSFLQGMPSGGSLSRTAVNLNAGARTRLSNIFAGLFILAIVLLFSKGIERVAMAALAGQLIVAAFSLIRPDVIKTVFQISWSGRLSMLATFASTLVLPLEYSIYIGVGLSLIIYVWDSADRIQVLHLVPLGDFRFREEEIPSTLPAHSPVVFSIYGNMFFAAVNHLEELLPSPETADHTVVILRVRHNHFMGSTGLRFFRRYADVLRHHNSKLILTGVGEGIREQLEHVNEMKEDDNLEVIFADNIVFSATQKALDFAYAWLAEIAAHETEQQINQ